MKVLPKETCFIILGFFEFFFKNLRISAAGADDFSNKNECLRIWVYLDKYGSHKL